MTLKKIVPKKQPICVYSIAKKEKNKNAKKKKKKKNPSCCGWK